jgi:transcriptional regulator with XRE-family HTH domain
VSISELRSKRVASGLAGHLVCQQAGISRTRLSDIERGYAEATPDELRRIEKAIDGIMQDRQHLAKLAADAGISLRGVQL